MSFLAPLAQASLETHLMVHKLFETAALLVGAILYRRARKRAGHGEIFSAAQLPIFACGLMGAALGNRLAFWIDRPDLAMQFLHDMAAFLQGGQSVIGGLIGGLIGIEIGKKIAAHPSSTGDYFVQPILVGLIIGRIGCFLAGVHDETYGVATTLPWAVDFGDGIARHPTQIYDMIFAAVGLVLWRRYGVQLHAVSDGLGFKIMMCSYMFWRLCVEFIKPMPYTYGGLFTGLQLICIAFLLLYVPLMLRQWQRVLRKSFS